MGLEDYPQIVIVVGIVIPFALYMFIVLYGKFESEDEQRGMMFAGLFALMIFAVTAVSYLLSALIR